MTITLRAAGSAPRPPRTGSPGPAAASTRGRAGVLLAAAVVFATVTLAGCGRGAGGTGGPGTAAPDGSPAAVPATGSVSGPPPLVDATPPRLSPPSPTSPVPGSRARTVPWTFAGTARDGRVLLLDVTVGGPPCDVVTGAEARESATTVRVTVYAGTAAGASCGPTVPAVAATERVQVPLARPLGTRTPVAGA